MAYLAIWLAATVAALTYAVIDMARQRNFWRAKHDSVRLELDQINRASVDANFQRIYNKPVFGEVPEKQKAANIFELGHDRAERERKVALSQPEIGYATDNVPDALTEDDLEHLDGLKQEGSVQ